MLECAATYRVAGVIPVTPRRGAVTESSSKDPKKRGLPPSGEARSPLEDLVPGAPGAQPEDEEQAAIVLDMEDEPLVLDVAEAAAPTRPEPEPTPPAAKAPAPVPAVILDDASLAPPAAGKAAAAKPAPAKPAPQ